MEIAMIDHEADFCIFQDNKINFLKGQKKNLSSLSHKEPMPKTDCSVIYAQVFD